MAGVLIKGRGHEDMETQEEFHLTTKAEIGVNIATSQGTPKMVSKPPEAKKRPGRILLYRFQREYSPEKTIISGFWLPEL